MRAGNGGRTYAIGLDLDEGRLVFEALAERPFRQVYELIGRLNSQANEFAAGGDVAARRFYRLDEAEFGLVISALSDMPFNRVHTLLARLTEQARAQAETPLPDAGAVADGRT